MTEHKKDCRCPVARHLHGTNAAYVNDACRCLDCTAAAAAVARERYRLKAYGWWEPRVSGVGVARRLQGLAWMGHGSDGIGRRIGVSGQMVAYWRLGRYVQATAPTVRKVTAVYDDLWSVRSDEPMSTRTHRYAIRNGWGSPLCWDDETIDDPAAVPARSVAALPVLDEIAVERFMHGTLRTQPNCTATPELLEAVRRLAARGLTDRAVGERVALSADAVLKLRTRHGIPTGPRTLAEAS